MDDFIERLNSIRNNYYGADKDSLASHREYASVDELQKNLSSGCFRIDIESAHYECFFHYENNTSPKKLYVFLGAAREPIKNFPKATFFRWSYHSLVECLDDGAVLCVFDPMHYRYPDLRLGWYYGTANECYLKILIRIVKGICSKYGLADGNVVFFGSSGGGYASLYSATILQGATAIAVNPQIYLNKYDYADSFEKITGIDLQAKDKFHRNDLPYLMKQSKSEFIILGNIQSQDDMNDHLLPFCEVMGIDTGKLSYGLLEHDNILLWLYDAKGVPEAHNSVETKSIFGAIDYIAGRFTAGNLNDDCRNLALLVNECWRDLYDAKYEAMGVDGKEVKDPFVVYFSNLPCSLNGNDIVDVIYSLRLEPTDKDYNYYSYDKFFSNMLYTLMLDVDADYPQCSIGLLSRDNKTVNYGVYSTKERIKYSFMVGDDAEGLRFVVHAGLGGQSKGKSLLIKSFTVMARPLDKLEAGDDDHRPGDVYWLDECSKALTENEWTKDSTVALYDHHALPWRQTVELQNLLRERKPSDILELGLGESSKLLAQYANYAGANHVIIDADPNYSRAFLQSSPAVFAKTKVHISPLLKVKKDEREYCCFQNFKKVVGSSKFGMIIQHCPRGGDSSLIYADVAMQLCDMLDNQFVMLLENADTPEMHIYIDDIVVLLQKRGISAGKKYIALPQGEFCLITSAKV